MKKQFPLDTYWSYIISVTETHNPNDKKLLFTAPNLEGYKKFIGETGTTKNSGCGVLT